MNKTRNSDLEGKFSLIDRYFDSGKFKKMIRLANELLLQDLSDEENGYLQFKTGEALLFLDSKIEALSILRECISILDKCNNTSTALLLKASCYFHLFRECNDIEKKMLYSNLSIKNYELLIERYPDLPDNHSAYSAIGDIYFQLEKYDESLQWYKNAISIMPDKKNNAKYLNNMALIYFNIKDFKKAAELFDQALKLGHSIEEQVYIHYYMGLMYYGLDLFDKANECMRLSLNYKEKDPVLRQNKEMEINILLYIGITFYMLGENKKTIIYLKKLLKIIDQNIYHYTHANLNLGHAYYKINKLKKAKYHYLQVVKSNYNDQESKLVAHNALANI